MIKAIAFDVGNVLLELHYDRMVEALVAAGSGDGAALRPLIDELLKECDEPASLKAEYELGRLAGDEFVRRFNAETGLAITRATFQDAWNELFAENKDIKETVAKLAGQLPLALLSNTNAMHAERFLRDYEVFRHFRERVFSYEVGVMKPRAGIFRAALAKLALAPEELFFVDDREVNVEGAKRLGITAFHYRDNDNELAEALRREGLEI